MNEDGLDLSSSSAVLSLLRSPVVSLVGLLYICVKCSSSVSVGSSNRARSFVLISG